MSGDGPPTVAIIGLGLIGGSLARDLAASGCRVVAADRDGAALEAAIDSGVVVRGFEADGAARPALAAAEMVIVATPVRSARALVHWLAAVAPATAVLTDVASTKRSILAAATEAGLSARFVGAHPMAGDHRSGWGAGRIGLFEDARVWVCHDGAARLAIERVVGLWASVGAIPREIDAAAHDHLMAWSSHLPQLAASALGIVLGRGGVDPSQLGPGGRDTTRLAGSPDDLWSEILLDNADLLEPCVDALVAELVRLRDHLHERQEAAVRSRLGQARAWARAPRR